MAGAVIAHTTVIGFDAALARLFGMALISGDCSVAVIYRLKRQRPLLRDLFDT